MSEKSKDRKMTFDSYTILRFLTYASIMDPLSKFATCQKLDNYYETPDFDYQHVLRFMDFLEEHHDDYLTWLYKQSMCLHSGNTNEQLTAIPLEKEVTKMLSQAKFIYCADAGLGSYNIRKFNSMGGRAFSVTQSIKKLSDPLKEAVFNDYDYKLLSDDTPITIKSMKEFDRYDKENLRLYNDYAYKIIQADKAVDLGLYEEITL